LFFGKEFQLCALIKKNGRCSIAKFKSSKKSKNMKKQKKQDSDPNFEAMKSLVASFQILAQKAHEQYAPLVEELIASNIKDEKAIQRLLDGILDFCCDGKMLILFKKLCRYFYYINPSATADYVEIYREMWDDEYVSPARAALN
jgi:hypothetical protein